MFHYIRNMSLTFDEVYQLISDKPGWMGESDCRALYNEASVLKNATIVEIGSYGGRSTFVMALASPTSKVIAIDPYIGFDDIWKRFNQEIQGTNITLIKEKAEDVKRTFEIDLLHIDGEHDYDSVAQDMKKYVPQVKSGGIVLFHDYVVPKFKVKEAVEDLGPQYFIQIDTVSGFGRGVKK